MDADKRRKLFQKVAESQVSGGGNNLLDGRGRLVVKRTAAEDGYNGSRFVFEFVVVASAKIPVTELKTGKALDITPNQVGTDLGIPFMLEKHDAALGALKGLVLALYGEPDVSTEELLETLEELHANNAAQGMVVDYSTYRKITQENKVEIVVPKWATVQQSDADIAAMKQWMDALTTGAQAAASA